MKEWKKIKIGNFLFERKGRYKPSNPEVVNLQRLEKIDFSGQFYIANKKSQTDMILIKSGDFVISGINVAKGAMGIYLGENDITATIHYSSYIFDKDQIDINFFKYFLRSSGLTKLLNEKVRGGIKTEIKPKHLLSLEINLPNLETQKSIASKIDGFVLGDVLHKQKTFLNKLRLSILNDIVHNTNKTIQLDKLCDFEKGSSPIQKTQAGQYPLVTTGNERKSSDAFQFDAKAVCIPLVSSTGHGSKSLNYIHYQEGKFALGTILVALIAKDPKIINMKFLHHFLFLNKDNLIVSLMKGMANVTVPIGELKKINIPLPNIEEQEKFEIVMKKLDELENNIGNNEKNADLLMQAILQETCGS